MTDTPGENALTFNPDDYREERKNRGPLVIGEHSFRLVDRLDSYTALALRDMAIENFVHEDDRERFLDTWETEEWELPLMTKIAEDLGKSFSPPKKGNRAQRRGRR